jgi:hypothetical protein
MYRCTAAKENLTSVQESKSIYQVNSESESIPSPSQFRVRVNSESESIPSPSQASRPISTQENFPQKENFVKCDCGRHKFSVAKKFRSRKFSTFNNDIFGKFSVRENFF